LSSIRPVSGFCACSRNPEQVLEHQDILQLIFHPGLSTADQVTQISGRGVIKASLTATVVGTRMVKTVPCPYTESTLTWPPKARIVRVSPASLEQYFGSAQELFEFENKHYPLRYLS
jgi:hypothetical protein